MNNVVFFVLFYMTISLISKVFRVLIKIRILIELNLILNKKKIQNIYL